MVDDKGCLLVGEEEEQVLIQEHEKKLIHIVKTLPTFGSDVNQLFVKGEEEQDLIPGQMQLIGTFTIVDVLANYWAEYNFNHSKPSERFIKFMERFCFVKGNIEYRNRKYLNSITIEELYEFRNGLVHFYGLYGNKYSIIPHASKKHTENDIENWRDDLLRLSHRRGIEMHFIQPFEVKKIVVEGAVLMLKYLHQREKSSGSEKLEHIKGIDRIYQKLMKEGASFIDKEMAVKLHDKMREFGI